MRPLQGKKTAGMSAEGRDLTVQRAGNSPFGIGRWGNSHPWEQGCWGCVIQSCWRDSRYSQEGSGTFPLMSPPPCPSLPSQHSRKESQDPLFPVDCGEGA